MTYRYVTFLLLELQEESCEEIHEENLDRAVSFYFDETQSVSELGSSFEKVFNISLYTTYYIKV
jgi:hypothetical protein